MCQLFASAKQPKKLAHVTAETETVTCASFCLCKGIHKTGTCYGLGAETVTCANFSLLQHTAKSWHMLRPRCRDRKVCQLLAIVYAEMLAHVTTSTKTVTCAGFLLLQSNANVACTSYNEHRGRNMCQLLASAKQSTRLTHVTARTGTVTCASFLPNA